MAIQTTAETLPVDQLRSTVDLPRSVLLYPLGFPVRIESNSAEVIRAAVTSWEKFEPAFDREPVRLCLGVEGDLPAAGPATFRNREHLLSIFSDPANFVVCDVAKGFSFGWVTRATVSNPASLRYYFLDAAALAMVVEQNLTPLHAGLVVWEGHGILLCGDSFAGKSTLTYACARSGWTLVSDDGTFLVRGQDDRFGIGNPYVLRFREDARFLFPELREFLPGLRPNGKEALEVATSDLPGIATSRGCAIEHVVFLDRHAGGTARLRSFPRDEALVRMDCSTHYGPRHIREERAKDYRRLMSCGFWQLEYGDLDEAVARLTGLALHGS